MSPLQHKIYGWRFVERKSGTKTKIQMHVTNCARSLSQQYAIKNVPTQQLVTCGFADNIPLVGMPIPIFGSQHFVAYKFKSISNWAANLQFAAQCSSNGAAFLAPN